MYDFWALKFSGVGGGNGQSEQREMWVQFLLCESASPWEAARSLDICCRSNLAGKTGQSQIFNALRDHAKTLDFGLGPCKVLSPPPPECHLQSPHCSRPGPDCHRPMPGRLHLFSVPALLSCLHPIFSPPCSHCELKQKWDDSPT